MDALTTPPPRKRRTKIIGSIIAIVVMVALGALAWYLKNLPFVYPDFSIAAARAHLERLHRDSLEGRPIQLRQPLFRLTARRGGDR